MALTDQLLLAIKRALKSQGLTYRDLAMELELSEPTVKRMFSVRAISVERLERICDVLGLSLVELATFANLSGVEQTPVLTADQELHLAHDARLLAVFYLLLHQWDLRKILKEYELTRDECRGYLRELDRLKLIELHPKDRVRVLVPQNITWRHKGSLWQLRQRRAQREFLAAWDPQGNTDDAGQLLFLTGELTDSSRRLIDRKIKSLEKTFNELKEIDATLDKHETVSFGLMMAYRPWVYSVFSALKKKITHPENHSVATKA